LATKAVFVKSSLITNPTPPSEADNANALGFNNINPTSGKNLPYEPEGV
jgi:hypothetical protein